MDLNLGHMPPPPKRKDYKIGAIGAGFIMRDIHLVAYAKAGFQVEAICGKPPEAGREVAALRGVAKAYDDLRQVLADPAVEIVDIALPPHLQLDVVKEACQYAGRIKGILAQKPLAMNYAEALELVDVCGRAGVTLAVNQNMRYDQSIRALKTLLDRGWLGEPVLATIEMRAIPHWQTWLKDYPGLTLHAMSIHHLDCFRFLFGDPESVYVSARTDPRTKFPHKDGIVLYILEYNNGFRASSWDDVWAGPAREGGAPDLYIKWRVEGTEGMAQGAIGWPGYPNSVPSTIEFTTRQQPGIWLRPHWTEVWFPDAFQGTMGELLDAVTDGVEPPFLSGRDNVNTIALVDACYRSIAEHRPVRISEITVGQASRPVREVRQP